MFKMYKVLAFLGVLLSVHVIFAQNVTIRGVRLSGSGCDAATATAVTTSDGKILSIIFDNYSVEIGQGSVNPQATSLKKDCHVMIDVDVPNGFQFALDQTEYRGFSAMPSSAYGSHRFMQITPGVGAPPTKLEAQLTGPMSQNYSVIVNQNPGREVYSACNKRNQTVMLFSQLQIAYYPKTTDRSIAMINLDSIDTGVNSRFHLLWRACR